MNPRNDPFPYGSDAKPVETRKGIIADENMLGQEELADAEVNWSPSRKLQPKMEAVVVTGALATVIVFVLTLFHIEVPETVAVALAVLLASVAGYRRIE
jgi:hypothetical protein